MNETERKTYQGWIEQAKIYEPDRPKIDRALHVAMKNRETYEIGAQLIKVPWTLLAALHEREAGGNLDKHPANGDSLRDKTHNVPSGLPRHVRPPFTYLNVLREEMAELVRPPDGVWTLLEMCHAAEHFNGLGYRGKGLPSPYVVGSTTIERHGKYIADHVWDKSFDDPQIGCLALWLAMEEAGIDVP